MLNNAGMHFFCPGAPVPGKEALFFFSFTRKYGLPKDLGEYTQSRKGKILEHRLQKSCTGSRPSWQHNQFILGTPEAKSVIYVRRYVASRGIGNSRSDSFLLYPFGTWVRSFFFARDSAEQPNKHVLRYDGCTHC